MDRSPISRRAAVLSVLPLLADTGPSPVLAQHSAANSDWALRLVAVARSQIGVTRVYDPAYTRLAYPGGDVPRDRGVCCDVIVRAYRDAFGIDLQHLVHTDMSASFGRYPRQWGLSRPDPSIDHRRVLNLEVFLERKGWRLGDGAPTPEQLAPGDLATQRLPGNRPHIAIVSDRPATGGRRLAIHNIGAGAEESDVLASHPLVARFRMPPHS